MMKPTFLGLLLCMLFSVTATAQMPGPDHTVIRPAPQSRPLWLGLTLKFDRDKSLSTVSGVLRRSPATGSGVVVGDEVLRVGDTPVKSLQDIRRAVNQHDAGDEVAVAVRRDGKENALTFKLAAMPDGEDIVRNHLLGYPAPDFTFQFVGDGKRMKLSKLRGKPTILEFWATWCGPCHRVQRQLAEVKSKYGDQVNLVGVSEESAQTVRDHLLRYPARYAMAVDEGASRGAYAVQSIPMIVLLDAEHNIAAIVFGANHQETLEAKLRNLLPQPAAP